MTENLEPNQCEDASHDVGLEATSVETETHDPYSDVPLSIRTVKRKADYASERNPGIRELIEAEVLEPVRILEAPIDDKKVIAPVLLTVVGGIACAHYIDATKRYDKAVRPVFNLGRSKAALEKITYGHYSRVGSVVGTKLPVTTEYLEGYFDKEKLEEVNPEQVTRLQFDATLVPLGGEPYISRVGAVIYEATNAEGQPRIVNAVRKADRLAAELALKSMTEIAISSHRVFLSQSYEILTGLPSLGKNR